MKKFLLCMLLAGLMLPVVAQEKRAFENVKSKSIHVSEMRADLGYSAYEKLPMNPKGAITDVANWKYAGISEIYDRQTQGDVYPMAKVHDDGFIGCTWTNEDNEVYSGASAGLIRRGVAYSYSKDGGETWTLETLRVGGIPLYWPSYAQWGAEGEVILARCGDDKYELEDVTIVNGLVLLTREKKGEGAWKLTPVPYPEGTPLENGFIMAWSRMVTSGTNHEYIHFMTHTRHNNTNVYYEGYHEPVFYYKTSDGGETWDHLGVLMPEAAGISWHEGNEGSPSYTDNISIAAYGDVVAASFIRLGFHNYVLKTVDNGDTWEATQFFHSSVRFYGEPAEFADTCYIPTQGNVAIDINGKVHIAFGNWLCYNLGDESIQPMKGWTTGFLSYWNEDMKPLDGYDYLVEDMQDIMIDDFLDAAQSTSDKLYIKSTTPKWPIVGFFTPTEDEFLFTDPTDYEWAVGSYGASGMFSFPQMTFDADNTMHLTYLGLLDKGDQEERWLRHAYYTTRTKDGIWSPTEYLVDDLEAIDKEFAYLTCAGAHGNNMYLMAQVDPYAGTYLEYVNDPSDHNPSKNYYYVFPVKGVSPPPPPCGMVTIDEVIVTPTYATIKWEEVEGAEGYEIIRDGDLLATVDGSTYTEYVEDDFVNGVTYTWEIKTICDKNVSLVVKATGICGDERINEIFSDVVIYPNPVSGTVTINAANFAKVEVYNTVGQLIEVKKVNTFDVSSYNTGVYLFKVYNANNNSVTKRVMVTR